MRLYDEFTIELARRVPFRVETVDRVLAMLASRGVSAKDAGRWIELIAAGRLTPSAVWSMVGFGVAPPEE